MNRSDNFTLRLSTVEREIVTALAQAMERSASDAIRVLLREKAREMGILPNSPNESRRLPITLE